MMPHLYTEPLSNFPPDGVYRIAHGGAGDVALEIVNAAHIAVKVLLEHLHADIHHVPRG